ncbi:hypothetical protein FIM12_06395 [SAR202 cluster bacterium AD-804-J14_MRT_500m]|nr:hypothetical protein [SAR202 cluster bacterium AD-804-J14_MRT_500m]
MTTLEEIVNKAIADYGFRQIVQWSPEDVITQWNLSEKEAAVLVGPIKDELDQLPVPVEPSDVLSEQNRLGELIQAFLSGS